MKWIMGASLGLAAVAALAILTNGPGQHVTPALVATATQSQTRGDSRNPFASSLTAPASQRGNHTSRFGIGGLRAISNISKESEPPVPSVAPSVRNVDLVNGIQPRIQKYIEDRYLDSRERMAMEKLAEAQQQALIRGTQSRQDAKEIAKKYSQAITCMALFRGVDNRNPDRDHKTQYDAMRAVTRESKELLGKLLTDKDTFAAYALYMQNLNGQVLHGTTPEVCQLSGELP